MRAEAVRDFYRGALDALNRSGIPYMVGGAYALGHHTGIHRETKDLDLFIRLSDAPAVFRLFHVMGTRARTIARHWLGKAVRKDMVIDFVWGFRNGVGKVEDAWFERTVWGPIFGLRVPMLSIEDMVWSKAFVMERDRYDGADIAHLLRAGGRRLDWRVLLERFGSHWPVLLSHLILVDYIFPKARDRALEKVRRDLLERWLRERDGDGVANGKRLCRGTLFSHTQYVHDLRRGYHDARLSPTGSLTRRNILE
jgi:hypothetical protein